MSCSVRHSLLADCVGYVLLVGLKFTVAGKVPIYLQVKSISLGIKFLK